MKKVALIIAGLCFIMGTAWSQKMGDYGIPLIGSTAPSFTAQSTNGTINFPADFGNHWKILFSHPKDFTPVCSSELIELSDLQPQFNKLNTKVLVVSTDNLSQHKAWKESLETLNYKDVQTPKINFPIIDDNDKAISIKYGMLQTKANEKEDIRGVFIIDPNNTVRAVFFYPTEVGRNMDEIVRTVEALQTAQNNIVTPADWKPGNDVMLKYLTDKEKSEIKSKDPDIYQVAWYMTLMKEPTP